MNEHPEDTTAGAAMTDDTIAEIPVAPLEHPEAVQYADDIGTVAGLMTADEFFAFFSQSFTVAGGVYGMVTMSPPLQSLMTAGELATARPASDAIYGMASKFSWLQFLIRKEGAWIAQAAALAAFGMQLSVAVMAELKARTPIPQPANDNATAAEAV